MIKKATSKQSIEYHNDVAFGQKVKMMGDTPSGY